MNWTTTPRTWRLLPRWLVALALWSTLCLAWPDNAHALPISGTIYEDLNMDGVFGPEDAPYPADGDLAHPKIWVKLARVASSDSCALPAMEITELDSNGKYQFSGDPYSLYCVFLSTNDDLNSDAVSELIKPVNPSGGRLLFGTAATPAVNKNMGVHQAYMLMAGAYFDVNGNGPDDGDIPLIGDKWQAKITTRINETCQAPALAVGQPHNSSSEAVYLGHYLPGDYCLIIDNNKDLNDITSTTPYWKPVSGGGSDGTLIDGQWHFSVGGLAMVAVGFQPYLGLVISGHVFRDTGAPDGSPGATANNGIRDGAAEPGLSGITVTLTRKSDGRLLGTAVTDSDGLYQLIMPNAGEDALAWGETLVLTQTNAQGHLSTGASVQDQAIGADANGTGYTYDRETDSITFQLTGQRALANVNFGDVPDSALSDDGKLDGVPGTDLIFPHRYTAGSAGKARFGVVSAPTPPNEGWISSLYRDLDCDAQISDGDAIIDAQADVDVTAGQQICLIHKQSIPANANAGDHSVATVSAELIHANAQPALNVRHTREDRATVLRLGGEVEGAVYGDLNANGQRDASETGTGATWWIKLISRTRDGACAAPALTAVQTDPVSGAYRFTNVNTGDYCLVMDDNNDLSDIASSTPGWMPMTPSDGLLAITVDGNKLLDRDFGLYRGLILSGHVFLDTGAPSHNPGATANNGVQDGAAESGQPGITLTLTRQADGRVLGTAVTGGDGAYTLIAPATANGDLALGDIVVLTQTNAPGHLSTGASVQGQAIGAGANGAGYTYDRQADRLSFQMSDQYVLNKLDFGDVPESNLSDDGNLSGPPGTVLTFPHRFTAGSAGKLRLSVVSAPTPPNDGWADVLYRDLDCDAQLASSDAIIDPRTDLDVLAGEQICLIHKQSVPAATNNGDRNIVTVNAELNHANAQPALNARYTRKDLSTVGQMGVLELIKEVRRTAANCVPLPAPGGDWMSSNQAQPGSWLQYRVTYRNIGPEPLTNLVINDSTPAFTRFHDASCGTATPEGLTCMAPSANATPPSAPRPGTTGLLRWEFQDKAGKTGGLMGGATGNVDFCVQVEP